MGIPINKLVSQGLGTAFSLGSDLCKANTYKQKTPTDYDPALGSQTATEGTAQVTAMVLQYTQEEKAGSDKIHAGDEKVLIRAVDFGPIVPHEDDTMVDVADATLIRQVIGIKRDPTGQLYTLQMRRLVA